MFDFNNFVTTLPVWVIIIVGLWSLVWKGIAMWKCGRHNQLVWFIVILIFNTLGILPIVYLLFFQKKTKKVIQVTRKRVRPRKKAVKKRVVKKKVKKKR